MTTSNEPPAVWTLLKEMSPRTEITSLAEKVGSLTDATEKCLGGIKNSLQEIRDVLRQGAPGPDCEYTHDTVVGLCCLFLAAGQNRRLSPKHPLGEIYNDAGFKQLADFFQADDSQFRQHKDAVINQVQGLRPEFSHIVNETTNEAARKLMPDVLKAMDIVEAEGSKSSTEPPPLSSDTVDGAADTAGTPSTTQSS